MSFLYHIFVVDNIGNLLYTKNLQIILNSYHVDIVQMLLINLNLTKRIDKRRFFVVFCLLFFVSEIDYILT